MMTYELPSNISLRNTNMTFQRKISNLKFDLLLPNLKVKLKGRTTSKRYNQDYARLLCNIFVSSVVQITSFILYYPSYSCFSGKVVFKLIKTYLRSQMAQSRLSNLAMILIGKEETKYIDRDNLVSKFASVNAKRDAKFNT